MCEILFIQGLFWVYIELWKTVKSEQQTGFKHLYTTTRINLQTTRDVLSLLQSARTCYITVTVDKCSVCVQLNHTLTTLLHLQFSTVQCVKKHFSFLCLFKECRIRHLMFGKFCGHMLQVNSMACDIIPK